MNTAAGEPPLAEYFSFERSAVRLTDGGFFQPLREASARWVLHERMPYRMSGYGYECLYRLRDGSFVWLEFTSMQLLDVTRQNHPAIVEADGQVVGERIDARSAVEFLVDARFEIPDDLQELLRPSAREDEPTAPRPMEFWARQEGLSFVQSIAAHEVRVTNRLADIRDAAVLAVQEIRRWRQVEHCYQERRITPHLGAILFARYRVDPNRWWGARNSVPPSDVELMDLPWPDGVEDVKTRVIPELRSLIRAPALVILSTMPSDGSGPPTEQEVKLAVDHLIKNLPAIEGYVVQIGKCVDDLRSGQVHRKLRDEAPKALKPPSDDEIAAYMLSIVGNLTHAEINERLKLGRVDGTISRMISRARSWFEQGNPLPESISELASYSGKKISMDPGKIDMGANREGRSPRQRNRGRD